MHLVAPLISGIQNAGNGSAAVFHRGTTNLATLYSSFEGDAFASSSLDANDRVILDSYGRAEVYVDQICDVFVYALDGTLQIAFTAGFSAGGIEVISPAFNGNAYDFSVADAPGYPTTLQAVLDLWFTTRSMADWGLTSAAQPLFVVTDDAYGARGDGVSDDVGAIGAALAAANAAGGGIVFFPAGSYRLTLSLNTPINNISVKLLGVGRASQLKLDSASGSLLELGIFSRLSIEGLELSVSQTNPDPLIHIQTAAGMGGQLELTNCSLGFGDGISTGPLIWSNDGSDTSTVRLSNCRAAINGPLCSLVRFSGTLGHAVVENCALNVVGSAHTGIGLIYGNDLRVKDTSFELSYVTSGTVTCIKFNTGTGDMQGKVTGCYFGGPGGSASGVAMDLAIPGASSTFVESSNRFAEGFTQYTTPSLKAYVYGGSFSTNIRLYSRDNRSIVIVNNTAGVDVPTDQYGTVIVKSTHAAVQMDGDRPPVGASGSVFFYHPSGAAGTAELDQNFFGDSVAATTATGSTHVWQYICCTVNVTLRMMVTVDARLVGDGA